MGQLRARGPGLFRALERALPVDFDGWPSGVQRYTLLLNEQGGIDDDLMVARLDDEVAIVANASRKDADLARLQALCPELEIRMLDAALIALQGPRAEEVLPEAAKLVFMQIARVRIGGVECLVSRSGYTGEDGFEISVPAAHAEALARRLLAHPAVKPAGLGARDTLRLEAGLPLHGQDIDANTTPREAGLEWALPRSRRAGGRAERRLAGFVGVDPVPVRSGAELVDATGKPVGRVTSGTVSPTLGKPVMLAYVTSEDAELQAVVRGKRHAVRRTSLPFVPKRYKR
jgi:aminomethyltransferase